MKCPHWSLFCQINLSENFRTNFPSTFCKKTSFQTAFFTQDQFSLYRKDKLAEFSGGKLVVTDVSTASAAIIKANDAWGVAVTSAWQTWFSNDGRPRNQIDHMRVRFRWTSSVMDCRAYTAAQTDSKHGSDPAMVRAHLGWNDWRSKDTFQRPMDRNWRRKPDAEVAHDTLHPHCFGGHRTHIGEVRHPSFTQTNKNTSQPTLASIGPAERWREVRSGVSRQFWGMLQLLRWRDIKASDDKNARKQICSPKTWHKLTHMDTYVWGWTRCRL